MAAPAALLTRFMATPPRYEITQARCLAWLAAAHAASEASLEDLDDDARAVFEARIARLLGRCAAPPTKIARRGISLPDFGDTSWDDHALYELDLHPHGRGSGARTRIFADVVDRYFAAAYADETAAPDDLIHVTCTGYVSPSGAQKVVAQRGWGARTRVTHAYQMGCYAAVPAVRMAAAYLALAAPAPWRCDIVHTELCSLHLDPTDHRIEQLVVQSLFADGLIRYAMISDDGSPGLRLRALHEQLLPDSADAMSWAVADWGMQMTLSRDVPDRIAGALRGFVVELFRRAGLDLGKVKDSVFAVHPGGPKIIDRIRDVLELDPAQVATSCAVLFDHGNMSSATLPHIWMRLLEDPEVPRGTLIPSLAFGPGLTMCGAVFEKR
jgi:predicted naringenin-chalcone synthase